jgi:acetyl-CoA C-acetyltransferase
MGGVDLHNIFYMTQRPQLYDSPAIREASCLALKQAGLKLEDIDVFDLYSCFPCMVDIARREIGIPDDDPRDLTITGGLSFFGGPFTSYSMHPIVTAVDLIQKNPSTKVLILANGGYNTSESVGIYGNRAPAIDWQENEYDDIQQKINSKALPEPVEEANGELTIEAYTIIYDRNGSPEKGIVIGRLESGKRSFAILSSNSETLEKLEKEELVGKTFLVKYNNKTKQNNLIIEH